jgi:hypothetical protein
MICPNYERIGKEQRMICPNYVRIGKEQKPNSKTYNFVEVSWHNLEFSDLRFPYTMFTLQTSFKPPLLNGGGGSKIR